MASTVCHDEYCEPTLTRKDSFEMTLGDKMIVTGGFLLVAIALGALLWYEASIGIYIDPASLS